MTAADSPDSLRSGSALLRPILEQQNFELNQLRVVNGSGGRAAVATSIKCQRPIETHVPGARGVVRVEVAGGAA